MDGTRITPPFESQQFYSRQQWVNMASSWLTCHPEYRNTEHGETKGWRGNHFTAMCFDALGRRVRNGGDFKRAEEEGTFPVWWIWPDQICELLIREAAARSETNQVDVSAEEHIWKFAHGDLVRKHSGSWWEGRVVGTYSTEHTPIGYAVQLDQPSGPVQIYPEAALEKVSPSVIGADGLPDELLSLLGDANAKYSAMTPEERDAMHLAQRESYVRGMTTPCEHGMLDFEQCTECRKGGAE